MYYIILHEFIPFHRYSLLLLSGHCCCYCFSSMHSLVSLVAGHTHTQTHKRAGWMHTLLHSYPSGKWEHRKNTHILMLEYISLAHLIFDSGRNLSHSDYVRLLCVPNVFRRFYENRMPNGLLEWQFFYAGVVGCDNVTFSSMFTRFVYSLLSSIGPL